MGKDLVEPHIFKGDEGAPNAKEFGVNLSSQRGVVHIINTALVVKELKSIFLIFQQNSCGPFSMNCLNNFGVGSFQLADVELGKLNVLIDLVENSSDMFFFDKGVLFQQFWLDHLTGFHEDGCSFEGIVYFVDCCSDTVVPNERGIFEAEIPLNRFQIEEAAEDVKVTEFSPGFINCDAAG